VVNPADAVSDINIAKTNEVVNPADAVSDITRSGEESVPKIITHEEIIASAPTSAPTSEIIKPEEITTSTSVSATPEIVKPEEITTSTSVSATPEIVKPEEIVAPEKIVASAPPAPQDIEKTTTQEQPIVEAVPVAPNQTSVMVESIDKLADYIAERIKQKLQEHSDNDPFTRVTTANANISQ
jgi:hypothetical protein